MTKDKKEEMFFTEKAKLVYNNLVKEIPVIQSIYDEVIVKLPSNALLDLIRLKTECIAAVLEVRKRAIVTASEIDHQERALGAHVAAIAAQLSKNN